MIPPDKRWYWIAGTLVAATGVVVARVESEWFPGTGAPYIRLGGILLGLGGLFIITLGTRRKI